MSGLDQEVIIASEEGPELSCIPGQRIWSCATASPKSTWSPATPITWPLSGLRSAWHVQLTVGGSFWEHGNQHERPQAYLVPRQIWPFVEKDQAMAESATRQIRVRLIGKADAWVTFTLARALFNWWTRPVDKALEPRKYELYILLEDWEERCLRIRRTRYEKK